jgi:hypothetical protein
MNNPLHALDQANRTPPVGNTSGGTEGMTLAFNGIAPARFGQLTYSSFDDGTGIGGGWQVKETSGGLTEPETELLRFWVHTIFELVVPLPAFPTPEEVAAFPRRLMYALLEDGRAGYWHTAPAGADGSGRPGNVFAHCLLDRDPTALIPPRRPIDLWRSPEWLTPYGPGDVSAAQLDAGTLPKESGWVNRNSVVDFLCDQEMWRLGVLSILLDAVESAMDGGKTVVLGTNSVDSAAMWIGAVSHLMSAGSARRFCWSTFDRASDVSGSVGRGLHLIAVPAADLAALVTREDLVVVNEDEMPAMGDLGGAPHHTVAGSEVEVTEWSVIAQAVMVDADSAQRVLDRQDEVAATISDSELHVTWPLAMAVALTPDLHEDVGVEAAAVIARRSPERLARHPDLFGAASFLIDRMLGSSVGDCWARLESVPGPGRNGYPVTVELMMTVYLERALRDRNWLMQDGGVPFPSVRPRDGWMPARLEQQVSNVFDELFQQARSPVETTSPFALYALRLIDLLIRANCVGGIGTRPGSHGLAGSVPTALETCHNILEATLVPVLFDGIAGPDFVERFGPLDPFTSDVAVVEVVASAPQLARGVLGRRMPEKVLVWLFPANLAPPNSKKLAAFPPGTDVPMAVVAAELAYQKLATQRPLRAWLRFSFVVLWRVLEQANNPNVQPPELEPIFRAPFDVDALDTLVRGHPGYIPPRFFTRTLVTAALSDSLKSLCRMVYADVQPQHGRPLARQDAADEIAFAAAAIRTRSDWAAMTREERLLLQRRFLDSALREALGHGIGNLSPDFIHSMAVLGISRAIEDPSEVATLDLVKVAVRAAYRVDREGLVTAVAALVRPDALKVSWLVETSIVGGEDGPDTRLASGSERFLTSLTRSVEDREISILDEIVDLLIDQGRYYGPVDLDSLDDLLRARIDRSGSRRSDKIQAAYRKSAKKWLDERGMGPGGIMSRLRRK